MSKKRVVVAMSGGVDSSVAAALLKNKGLEVVGMTMCFSAAFDTGGSASGGNLGDSSGKRPGCCSLQGIEDARRVADKLGIRHYTVNMQRALKDFVIDDFCREYAAGRTPNPCVRCNQYLKFGALLKKALLLDADFLATGHYARSVKTKAGYLLRKARDPFKDQSYFLYRLSQPQLKHSLFPLGGYLKSQIRAIARKFSLPVADKLASQEICFLPDNDYRGFLNRQRNVRFKPGEVVDRQGNVLGQHKGIAYYTIGQREGLGIARGYPIYITGIDPRANRIIVGTKEEVYKSGFLVREPHFVLKPIKKKVALKVRIRYNHKEALAEVSPLGNNLEVKFLKPQFAITPGQSAVFYDKNILLGGGIIDKVLA